MSYITGTFPAGIKTKGYEQVEVGDSAIGLSVPSGATRAVVGVESQPIRYRNDGEEPTSSVGFLVKADVTFELHGNEALKNFQAIRSGETDGVLNIIYYGE